MNRDEILAQLLSGIFDYFAQRGVNVDRFRDRLCRAVVVHCRYDLMDQDVCVRPESAAKPPSAISRTGSTEVSSRVVGASGIAVSRMHTRQGNQPEQRQHSERPPHASRSCRSGVDSRSRNLYIFVR